MVKSNESLYFEFKKLLFEAKKVLLDENGKQINVKDIPSLKLRELFNKACRLGDKIVLAINDSLET